MTLEEALSPSLPGWNLRCNLCGEHPADWLDGHRPGWGSLALCPEHAAELRAEVKRHDDAMQRLRVINFEQLSRSETESRRKAAERQRNTKR